MIAQDFISDNRLLTWFQKQLTNHPQWLHNPKLNAQRLCHSQVIHQVGVAPASFVVSNSEEARFFGVASCHSSWACPSCTAKVMANYGMQIACAIDALAKWKKQYAFMVTFTLPHVRSMSAQESLWILQKTWRRMMKGNKNPHSFYTLKNNEGERSKKGGKLGVGPAGSTKIYYKKKTPFIQFKTDLHIDYHVSVYEFTHGENSWHPHIHALFWVPKDQWKNVMKYEDSLNDSWWRLAKLSAVEYQHEVLNVPLEQAREKAENFYTEWRKNPKTGHRSVFFSKCKDGSLLQAKSSYYIAGWSTNHEMAMTKEGRKGHLTPFQILQAAYDNRLDDTKREYYLKLYVEYILATKSRRRINWATGSDIKEIIEKWKTTNEYYEVVKKKFMDKGGGRAWKVVCWFPEHQWSEICFRDKYHQDCIRTKILELALIGRDAIQDYLNSLGWDLERRKHPMEEVIEQKIFENRVTKMAS